MKKFKDLDVGEYFTFNDEELSIKIEQDDCESGINVLTFYADGEDFYFHNMESNDPVKCITNVKVSYSFDEQ